MKRILKWLAVTITALVFVFAGLFAWVFVHAFAGSKPILDGQQLTATARLVKDGFVDITVIDLGNGGLALVDAGKDKSGKAILDELKRRGASAEAIKAILITHGHGDHIGACGLFPHAQLYALSEEGPLIAGLAHPSGTLTKHMPVEVTGLKVDHPLRDGESFQLGDRHVTAFAVPGHTAGSAVYLVDDVLYFGDSAGATSDGKLRAAVDLFSDNPDQNVKSLKALAARLTPIAGNVRVLSFAHSGPLASLQPLLDFAASAK